MWVSLSGNVDVSKEVSKERTDLRLAEVDGVRGG